MLNADEMARARSRAREEYILHENALNGQISELSEENERLRAKLAQYEAANINMEEKQTIMALGQGVT